MEDSKDMAESQDKDGKKVGLEVRYIPVSEGSWSIVQYQPFLLTWWLVSWVILLKNNVIMKTMLVKMLEIVVLKRNLVI